MNYFTTSMMCADVFHLESQIKIIEQHTDFYHIDVMDGHFVPNITLGFDYIKQLRGMTKKPIDAHLMVTDPINYIDQLIEIGVECISLHPSTVTKNIFKIINTISKYNIKLGIVLSPSETLESISYYKEHIYKITVMTVEPGFAGQSVLPEAIKKIKDVRDYRTLHNLDYLIEVDGSNNYSTFKQYHDNGTDVFVLGSTLFKEKDLNQSFLDIKKFISELQ
jgi:D-allulose-6-phosphate 3-epimerase